MVRGKADRVCRRAGRHKKLWMNVAKEPRKKAVRRVNLKSEERRRSAMWPLLTASAPQRRQEMPATGRAIADVAAISTPATVGIMTA
jgi:hypothetical protein